MFLPVVVLLEDLIYDRLSEDDSPFSFAAPMCSLLDLFADFDAASQRWRTRELQRWAAFPSTIDRTSLHTRPVDMTLAGITWICPPSHVWLGTLRPILLDCVSGRGGSEKARSYKREESCERRNRRQRMVTRALAVGIKRRRRPESEEGSTREAGGRGQ